MRTVYVIITVYADPSHLPSLHGMLYLQSGKGDLTLLEHDAKKWLSFDELDAVDWLPVDLLVVGELRKGMGIHYRKFKIKLL